MLDLPVLHSIDWAAAVLSAFALAVVFRLKLGMVAVLGGAAGMGVVLHILGLA